MPGNFDPYSTPFMDAMAASASDSDEKRTNPKPRLRPVSRSLTTVWLKGQGSIQHLAVMQSYSFLHLAKLGEFAA